jgi:hypothetical protein
MADRFTKPETVRLALTDGDYIDVKKRLTHGEREDMWASMAPLVEFGRPMQIQRKELRTTRVLAYLVGWSLTNNGAVVPMSPDLPESARVATLRSLAPEAFDEIHAAIVAHEDGVGEATKKAPATESASPTL